MRGRRRGRGRRSTSARARAGARVSVGAGLVLMTVALLAPVAGANYARVEARAGCDGTVAWRASASVEGDSEDRTNERVVVQYRAAGSDGDWLAAGPEGSFTEDQDFSFTGSFTLPEGADAAELRVVPRVPWGTGRDGDPPGEPRFATASVPPECADQPLAASQQLDCATGSVVVRARNLGDRDIDAEVTADRVVVRALRLAPGTEQELVVPVLAGRDTAIQVRGGSFVVSDQLHRPDCPPGAPAAIVVERCTAPLGRLVVLATGGAEPTGVRITVRGSTVDSTTVGAGTVLQRTLDVPEGALPVEVRLDDTVAAAGMVGGCEAPLTGLLSCGTAGRPACDLTATRPAAPGPPPELIPPLQLDGGSPGLPRTGPGQRALGILVGGALLLGGGTALAARDRRRPVVSALATALAPYRQRWWDES